jgi:oligopeptide transport system ATP-binding protein
MSDGGPILKLRDLKVRFRTLDGMVEAVRGASFDVSAGETVAIVGESGSGKSQMMMAVMGLLAQNGEAEGIADYRGVNLLALSYRRLNDIRGRKIGMIFQEPMTSLDPLYTVGDQLIEPIVRHQRITAGEAKARAVELLELVHIPEARRRMNSYPYELSGGQRQRVMIAMAIANDPDLLIADEPTTALDVTIQAEILALLEDLQRRFHMGLVFITHDLGIVRRIADRVCVMRLGEIVEQSTTAEIFAAPKHPYTKALLEAEPEGRKDLPPKGSPAILEGRRMRVSFALGGGLFAPPGLELRAVDDVSISLRKNQTIGIVGESCSGKSTLARAFLKHLPAYGIIRFMGRDLTHFDRAAMRPLRRELQIVFQDPFG